MKKKKGFTLIELVAVLVIMAIIALIVTPLVLNIIRKVRISADKRSVDAYGRSIEYAIATYLLDTGNFPTSIGELTIEYSGDEVVCSTTQLNPDSSVYLTGCTVGGRSVDYAYGRNKNVNVPPSPNSFSGTGTIYSFYKDMHFITGYLYNSDNSNSSGNIVNDFSYALDPSELNSRVYLKHVVENNIIIDQYICFVTNKENCLKADSNAYSQNQSIIEENKNWFESQGCTVELYDYVSTVSCASEDAVFVEINFDGDGFAKVDVNNDNEDGCGSGDYGDYLWCS